MRSAMIAARVDAPGEPFNLVEMPVPEIESGEILIQVKACGICHSDLHAVNGDWSSSGFPKIPGHEIVGTVVKAASDVREIAKGDRVGLSWIYSTCGLCAFCRKGDETLCPSRISTGITAPGGYAEFIKARASFVAKIPDCLSDATAAPLLCAGATALAALRLAAVSPGERVAVYGIGGIGLIALQIAKQFQAAVTAVTSSEQKRNMCRELGADECIVGNAEEASLRLMESGGCDVILSTVPDSTAISPLISALRGDGRLLLAGAGPGEVSIRPRELISKRLRIIGSRVGNKRDIEDVLRMAAQGKIRIKVREYPLRAVNEAYRDLRSSRVDYRAVLVP